ncbi:MAG: TPM domain-containing protein [Candidatus Omnitrophica bacterium]|nr:TPM domain-containing protein [Candidatus Omnitrophota bacterium]
MVNFKVERSCDPRLFFSKRERERILRAIREAERKTSAEIRVHLEREFKGDFLSHAWEIFERLNMRATENRNGVLILLNPANRRFEVLGDRGIHERVPDGFWDDIADKMQSKFKEDRFSDGLVEGIQKIGERLREHFPYERNDANELPDGISYFL